jgi:DNA-binding response OmpR family regulator
VGEQWDEVKPVLLALASQSNLVFIGPTHQNIREATSKTTPAVIMIGPGYEYTSLALGMSRDEEHAHTPSVLACITHDALENDDLYEDVDDFLLVPCTAAELGKRLKRLVFKDQPLPLSSQLRVGRITLDPATYQVMLEDKRVDLAWLEFQLLKFLMENVGKVFTREQLLAHVWGVENFGGTRTVDVHIRRLRNKLEIFGDEYFRTVKNVGYGMVQSF